MDKERFSLLLLDPGEIYFEDFSAYLLPASVPASSLTASYFEKNKQIGRIKMCSKSIVFDPKDVMKPILKIPLKECSKISECNPEILFKISSNSNNAISIECRQYVEMMEGNVLLPYSFNLKPKNFLCLLNYAKLSDCLPPICQLHRASTLPAAEQNSMIAAIVYSRQNRVSFDTLWLDDLYEQVILESQGNKITPLVINPGRILLTSSRLYFQPYNNIDSYPVLKVHLQDVKRVVKRRFLLQHVGLEVYCGDNKQVTHLYLTLKSTEDRDALYEGLLAQHTLQLDDADQEVMTLQWQNGALSNYDYLLYLNSLADRTFNDLTQYPVFPWVVSDYTSTKLDLDDPKTFRDLTKPIGALNETRLSRLKERYEEMPHPKFLYGSHYSTPGFVLFYMVRKFPHLMLCLQNGRFDHPDRMFNSVSDTWSNVLKNMSDFKELIPAFYDKEENGDFCVNTYGINFGYRQDGSKIGDVKLPPWANGPQDFVKQLRDALESDHVSRYLNHWIDLIFGYKQVGAEAEKADNLFYYLCYEGAVDLDSIKEMNQRHALEVQIMEFGQIPKQIFTRPHPHRVLGLPPAMMPANSEPCPSEDTRDVFHPIDATTCSIMRWQNVDTLKITASFQSHKEAVTSVAIAQSKEFVVSVGQDSLLKIYTMGDKRQVRSVSLSTMPLSSCIILSDDKTLLVGSWDNHVTLYNLEFGRVLSSVRIHEDAVSRLVWGKTSNVLVSGSWDCSVRVWNGIGDDSRPFKLATSLAAELDHEAYITCLTIDRNNKCLVSGTQDGELFLWSLESNSLLQKLPGHSATVNAASFSPDGSKLVSCGDDNNFKVLDLSSRMQVYCKTLNEELKCLAWDGFTLLLGGSNGSLYIWDLIKVEMVKQIQAHNGPLLAIAVSDDGTIVVTAGQDHRVIIWESGS